MTVAELDGMTGPQAGEVLRSCCGASRWVEAMIASRPFGDREQVLSTSARIWRALEPADWKEAFSYHPRIGESKGALPQSEPGQAWSAAEQAGVRAAGIAGRRALAETNREYEARFGYIYVVCAAGKSAEELLALARIRLSNDPETELTVASEEQLKITRLRLEKLLASSE